MKLSIILPVYNAENYLKTCLESILKQTFLDFELILINDGSKDSSEEICQKYAKTDNRIIYISQPNQGVAMARNVGLKIAKGKYIGFIDADDSIEADMFKNLLTPTVNGTYDVIIAHYKICNEHSQNMVATNLPINTPLDGKQIKDYILQTYYTGGDFLVPALWNKIYNNNFLKHNQFEFKNQKAVRASDYWFNFEVFQKANMSIVLPNANYLYNNTITNSIINTFRENQFEGFIASQKKLLEANKTFNFKIDKKKFYTPFFNNTNQFILAAINKKGKRKAYSLIKGILNNNIFKESFEHVDTKKLHLKLIHTLLKTNNISLAYFMYCIWQKKQ